MQGNMQTLSCKLGTEREINQQGNKYGPKSERRWHKSNTI